MAFGYVPGKRDPRDRIPYRIEHRQLVREQIRSPPSGWNLRLQEMGGSSSASLAGVLSGRPAFETRPFLPASKVGPAVLSHLPFRSRLEFPARPQGLGCLRFGETTALSEARLPPARANLGRAGWKALGWSPCGRPRGHSTVHVTGEMLALMFSVIELGPVLEVKFVGFAGLGQTHRRPQLVPLQSKRKGRFTTSTNLRSPGPRSGHRAHSAASRPKLEGLRRLSMMF